jgi:hypothetical protein
MKFPNSISKRLAYSLNILYFKEKNMGANSATGTGAGAAQTKTAKELAMLANAPTIIFSGYVENLVIASPASGLGSVTFPYPLPGGASKYVVIATSLNAGSVYVANLEEDDDENFTGFTVVAETDGDVMYMVSKVGSRPNI